jgi:hypothetical protein
MKQFIATDAKRIANLKVVYITGVSPRLVVHGGVEPKTVPLVELSRDEIRRTITTNLKTPVVWN